MGHAGGHLTHGDQTAGSLCPLVLLGGLLFSVAAWGDVGGNHHLGQAPIDPGQVTGAHFQPLVQRRHKGFSVFRLRGGQGVCRQACQAIDGIERIACRQGCGYACLRNQAQVARDLSAKPGAVKPVGKQQFFAAQGCDRYRSIQPFKYGGKTLVRGGQFLANAFGLGDVGHGGHPAGLLAVWINQRRHIHAGIKNLAVLALHAHLKSAGRGAAMQLVVQPPHQGVKLGLGPVRKRWRAAHQLMLAQARHLAKRRVDIGDAACQIECAHAGQHGVFHGPAKVGL